METIKLKYFSVIAETGSLTKASEILNVSHSGLSKALASLQTETNLKLFRPLGRGLEITDEGRWFYLKAQEILKVTDEISRKKTVVERTTRIGMSELLAISLAPHLVSEIEGQISLIETDVGELEAKLLASEIDFGLAFVPAPKPELEYLELGELKFNSYASEKLQKKFEAAEIPYVVPASDYPFNPIGYRLRDGWPVDIKRNPMFSVSRISVALELLKSGSAALYLPDYFAKTFPQVERVREHKNAQSKRQIYLVKRKSEEESANMKKAAKVVRRVTQA